MSGWPDTEDQLHQDIRPYWSFKDDLAVIDGVVMFVQHLQDITQGSILA